MDNDSLVLLMCCLLISFSGPISGDLTIVESPSDACVCSGNEVQFNCVVTTPLSLVNGTLIDSIVDQKWRINRASSVDVEISSNNPPGGMEYSFVNDASNEVIGLIVLKADSTYHLANFTCIGFDSNQMSIPPLSTAAAILEVADLDDLSCSVSCPSLYSSGSSSCTVSWSKPPNASCDALFGYFVTITGNGLSMKSPLLDIDTITYITGQLEVFQVYTASVTATSTCGSTQPDNIAFMTSREQRPDQFDLTLLFTSFDVINISLLITLKRTAPRVAEYTVLVRNACGLTVLTLPPYQGNSTLLSLDIGSLPPCENYTVSVTARNTALESTSASVLLSLDPLTSLEVSCVAGEDGCYLEASCVPSQPGLVSGCRLDYMSSAGPALRNVTQLSTNRIAAVSCDNQTISYTGTVYDLMLRALGCPRSGVTKCPPMRGCIVLNATDGTMQYSTEPSASGDFTGGTVATYSCADGYELVGEENRTCLVDGTWTGAEPQCRNLYWCQDASQDSVSHAATVWFPISITLLIYSLALTAATVAVTLFSCRKTLLKGGHRAAVPSHSTKEEVALKENLCYGPVVPPPLPHPAATQTVSEYEEIGAPSPK